MYYPGSTGSVPVGNLSQFMNSDGNFAGNYRVSFGMTVRCPYCTISTR